MWMATSLKARVTRAPLKMFECENFDHERGIKAGASRKKVTANIESRPQ